MATNTNRKLVPTILLGLLLLVACDRDNNGRGTGPNDQELLTKAVADMKALKSYHFTLDGTLLSTLVGIDPDIHIVGDIQTDDKGSRIKATSASNTNNLGSTPISTVLTTEDAVDIILAKGNWYESYDGGKTWDKAHIDTPAYLWIATVGLVWDTRFSFGSPTPGEHMIQSLKVKDNSTTIELVDGVMTKHMVAEPIGTPEVGSPLVMTMEGAKTVSIWVSNDITPTIRQMSIEGSNTIPKDIVTSDGSYAPVSPAATVQANDHTKMQHILTWKWSHLNEDFGVVNPPSPEKVNTPSP